MKSLKKWVIVDKEGLPQYKSIKNTKKDCIDYFEAYMRVSSWEYLSSKGLYTCERIEINFLGGLTKQKSESMSR